MVFAEAFASHVWDNGLHGEIDNLGRDSEVDDLFSQPIRVYCERLRHCQLFFISGKWSRGKLEDIEIRNDQAAERDVDKSRQENAEIRCNEVEDKKLLGQRGIVTVCGFPVLKIIQSSCNLSQNGRYGGDKPSQQECRYKDLIETLADYFRWVCSAIFETLTSTLLNGPL